MNNNLHPRLNSSNWCTTITICTHLLTQSICNSCHARIINIRQLFMKIIRINYYIKKGNTNKNNNEKYIYKKQIRKVEYGNVQGGRRMGINKISLQNNVMIIVIKIPIMVILIIIIITMMILVIVVTVVVVVTFICKE